MTAGRCCRGISIRTGENRVNAGRWAVSSEGEALRDCRARQGSPIRQGFLGSGRSGVLVDGKIYIGTSRHADDSLGDPQYLALKYANRHGLITGATGTGKTVTLQILAEGFSRRRRAGVRRRREGRPLRHRGAGRAEGLPAEARRRHRLCRRIPARRDAGDLLGPVRRAGPPDPHHGLGDGAAAAGAADGPQRDAGRRAQHRLQARRRGGAAAARPEGPAGAASRTSPSGRRRCPAATATSPRRRSAPSSGSCWCSSSRAASSFFGEPALEIADLMRTDARRARHRQRARRRPADAVAAALRDLPALAAVRAVRGAARGRRSGEAAARLLLRRGASPLRRGAEGARREGRAGGEADPLQGRRRLFRDAEPARHSRQRAGAARQPRAARAPRLYAARAEGGEDGGRDVPPQSRDSTSTKAITELGVGEALVSMLDDGGVPTWWSARWSARRRRGSGRSRRRSGRR